MPRPAHPLSMVLPLVLALGVLPSSALANWCDYRLSNALPRTQSPAVEAARSDAGIAQDEGVVYIMVNPRTLRTQVGATQEGSADSRDDGFVLRMARVVGAAVAVVAGDSALTTAGSAVLGAGLETVCFLRDERITEYDDVLAVMRVVDASMPPDLFALIEPGERRRDAYVRLSRNDGYEPSEYRVRDLYIVNGQLRHRDWGLNDVVGDLALFVRLAGH